MKIFVTVTASDSVYKTKANFLGENDGGQESQGDENLSNFDNDMFIHLHTGSIHHLVSFGF